MGDNSMSTIYDKQLSVMLTTEQVNEIKRKSQARKTSVSEYIRSSILSRMESEKDDLNDMVFSGKLEDEEELDSTYDDSYADMEPSDDLDGSIEEELRVNAEYLKQNMAAFYQHDTQ
jgi:hypothetical protein